MPNKTRKPQQPLVDALAAARTMLDENSWIDEITAPDEDGNPNDYARRVVPVDDVRDALDSIEAAAEREYEEAKNYFAKLHDGPSMICTAKHCALRNAAEDIVEQVKAEASFGHFAPVVVEDRPVGNAAAMRNALEFAEDELWGLGAFDSSKRVASALAAPARNCDTVRDGREALGWCRESVAVERDAAYDRGMRDAIRWLLAPAKKGGDHA